MRDSDRDRVSYVVVKKEGGIEVLEKLRGKTITVGAEDSPQATLIPLGFLMRHGLHPGKDFQVKHFNLVVGKHGDHVGWRARGVSVPGAGRCGCLHYAGPELGPMDQRWHH